jgi:hypothetical protein
MDSDSFTDGPSPGNDDNINQDSPPPGTILRRDLLPTEDDYTADPPRCNPHQYSIEQQTYLLSISQEASDLFPHGKVYPSIKQLREEVGKFGIRKGFVVTTVGSKLRCSRANESTSHKNRRDKINASGLIPTEKQRNWKLSTRCGCPFAISFAPVK